jgi:excisionase family DNA binding protein
VPSPIDPKPIDPARVVYSVREVARMLGVGKSTVYDAINRGDVPTVRLGRRTLVPRWFIDSQLEKRAGGPPAT